MGNGILTGNFKRDIIKVDRQTKQSASSNGLLQDARTVDVTNPKAAINRPHLVNETSANKPDDLNWGIREVTFYDESRFTIDILGATTEGTYAHWVCIGTNTNNVVSFGTWEYANNVDFGTVGSGTKPVYFKDGKPVEVDHLVESDVPENAVFTDTIYEHPSSAGNKHIPIGGSTGQILGFESDGTGKWINSELNINNVVVSGDGDTVRYNYKDGSYETVTKIAEDNYQIKTYNRTGGLESTVSMGISGDTIVIN